MNKKLELLDCTLRDGGYYTQWDYSDEIVAQYLGAMNHLPVDIVEIGYRNVSNIEYKGRFYYTPDYVLKELRDVLDSSKSIALMLNAKDFKDGEGVEVIETCRPYVKLIRIAVSFEDVSKIIPLLKSVRDYGFLIALNIMYMHRLNHAKSMSRLKAVTKYIDYLYFVDSYGSCFPEDVSNIISLAKENAVGVKIGFHGHDNLGLAFANSLAAYSAGATICDSTVQGMGRGAGNLKTEAISLYLSRRRNVDISLVHLSEVVSAFDKLKNMHNWGTCLPYMFSGMLGLPQNEVMTLLGMKRYGYDEILEYLSTDKMKVSPERLSNIVSSEVKGKGVVIIGGGESAVLHRNAVCNLAIKNDYVIVHSSIRHIDSYMTCKKMQIVCLPGNEKLKFLSGNLKINNSVSDIVVGNKTSCDVNTHDRHVNIHYVDSIGCNQDKNIIPNDSPLGLALGFSEYIEANKIYLIGFDGYPRLERSNSLLAEEVQNALYSFSNIYPEIPLKSLTSTMYDIPIISMYSLL